MREVSCGWASRWQARVTVPLLVACVAVISAIPARATLRYGPLQISGNFETQNLIRHPNPDEFEFIQNRNTFRLRVDWDWLQNGKLVDKINVPFIERSKLYVLYRGVYDGFYDLKPGDRQKGQTRFDDLIGGSIKDLTGDQRRDDKLENRLREAYVDLKLKGAPLSFRIGRQQVIWGESDQFRLMDIWNPLDTSWHFQQESWDNIRVPLWLAKGLWDIGDLGPLSNTFLEVVYNPFDFQPGIKAAFLPQPWGLPFPDPLRDGQINNAAGPKATADRLFSPNFCPNGVCLEGTSLRQGDFKRNPQDASEVGARFHFVTPQGLELSADYLYGRGRGVGAAAPFALKIENIVLGGPPIGAIPPAAVIGRYQPDIGNPSRTLPVMPVDITAKVIHPYMHIFGLTGNYSENDFTDSILRFETAYVMGEPFNTTDPTTLVPVLFKTPSGRLAPTGNTGPFGFEKRDVWAGMVGFDRPTWIRWLNDKSTWFLTFQFFWNYTTGGHVDQLLGSSGTGDEPYFGPMGIWTDGRFTGKIERQQDGSFKGNGDQVRRWEHLVTLAATTFYKGGTIVPFIASAWDPVNDSEEFLWNVDYFYTNDFIISLQQKFFTTYGSRAPSNDPWFAGGRFTRRDETGIKLTYQF